MSTGLLPLLYKWTVLLHNLYGLPISFYAACFFHVFFVLVLFVCGGCLFLFLWCFGSGGGGLGFFGFLNSYKNKKEIEDGGAQLFPACRDNRNKVHTEPTSVKVSALCRITVKCHCKSLTFRLWISQDL